MHKFNAGDAFPSLSGESVRHGTVSLPGDIPEGNYAVVWAYRADWWPHCHRQFADFAAKAEEIAALGISVYALSTDPLDKATATVERHDVQFPVLYGMDGPTTAELLGAYYEERRNIIQPVNFILGPDRKIRSVTISSGPVGRLTAEDVTRVVTFYQKQAAG